jgi:hypothetical protein
VFTVKQGKAQQQVVQIGQRNQLMAEVHQGLEADSEVVIYPSDQVKQGLVVRVQRTEAPQAP